MLAPGKFKFIKEYQQFHYILEVSSFTEYKKQLQTLKRNLSKTPQIYNQVAGYSFEFIIGVIIHLYGGMPQIGILEYEPTYVGDVDNPDFGADGYGLAFVGEDRLSTRRAIIQIKYRANEWATVHNWGQLPQQISNELTIHDTVNLTIITATNEYGSRRPPLETENIIGDTTSDRAIRKCLTSHENSRVFIRVIDFVHLLKLDSFHLWKSIRELAKVE